MLHAQGLRHQESIRTVTAAVGRPVNAAMSAADPSITVSQPADAGVKRISVGGAVVRRKDAPEQRVAFPRPKARAGRMATGRA